MKKTLLLLTLLSFLSIIPKNRSVNSQHKGLILLVPLHNEQNPQKIAEYIACLKQNIQNDYIKNVHILYDSSQDTHNNEIYNFLQENNIPLTLCEEKPTFQNLFDFANETYPYEKIIISNPNIGFNQTLGPLTNYDLKKKFIALSRWNKAIKRNLDSWTKNEELLSLAGQDSWIFQTPVNLEKADIKISNLYSDPLLYQCIKSTDMHLINPCLSIITNHSSEPEVRNLESITRQKQIFTVEACCLPIQKQSP